MSADRKPMLEELRSKIFATVPEIAAVMRTDQRTLRRSIEIGGCPHVRINGTVRIPVPAFLRWSGLDLGPEDSGAGIGTPASATVRHQADQCSHHVSRTG
jgi:hypothetical protein